MNLHRIRPGDRKSTRVALVAEKLPLETKFRVKATSSSTFVLAEFKRHRDGVALEPAQSVTSPVILGEISIEVLGDREERPYRESLQVALLGGGDEEVARCRIPITWEVSPELVATPRGFWLDRTHPDAVVSRQVLVSRMDRQPFQIKEVTCDVGSDLEDAGWSDEALTSHKVRLSVRSPKASGPWRRLLVIRTDQDDQGEVTIPFSGIVP